MLACASSVFNLKEYTARFVFLFGCMCSCSTKQINTPSDKNKAMDKRRTRALKASHHSRSSNRVHIHTGASAGAGQGGFGTEKGGGRRLARRPNHRRSVRPTAASAYCDARHQVNDCIHRCVSAITSVCWGRVWSLPGGRRKKPTTGLLGYSLTRPVSQSSFETHKPTTHPFHTSPMHSLRPTYKCFRQGSSLP